MIIDGHAHACGTYLSNESINNYLHTNSVDYVILVPGQQNSKKTYSFKDDTSKYPMKDIISSTNKLIKIVTTITNSKRHITIGNEFVFSLKINNPKIKQFFWITKDQFSSLDQKYEYMRFSGIKVHQCWEYIKISSIWFNELAEWLISHDLPLFIHLYSLNDVDDIITFAKNHSKLNIIIGHLFGMERYIEKNKTLLDNLYFDLSNNYFVSQERINKAINYIGSSKLLLGSDTPYGESALQNTINRINSLKIHQNEKDNILGNNLKLLLKI